MRKVDIRIKALRHLIKQIKSGEIILQSVRKEFNYLDVTSTLSPLHSNIPNGSTLTLELSPMVPKKYRKKVNVVTKELLN